MFWKSIDPFKLNIPKPISAQRKQDYWSWNIISIHKSFILYKERINKDWKLKYIRIVTVTCKKSLFQIKTSFFYFWDQLCYYNVRLKLHISRWKHLLTIVYKRTSILKNKNLFYLHVSNTILSWTKRPSRHFNLYYIPAKIEKGYRSQILVYVCVWIAKRYSI